MLGVAIGALRAAAGGLRVGPTKSYLFVGSLLLPGTFEKFLGYGPEAEAPVTTESVTLVLASLAFMNAYSSFFVIGLRFIMEGPSS